VQYNSTVVRNLIETCQMRSVPRIQGRAKVRSVLGKLVALYTKIFPYV